MRLEGRLEDLSLPDIFQIVSLSKRSGILVLVRKEGTGRVVFNRGHVLYASADNKSRLGYSLVRKGIITNEDLENALMAQKAEGFKKPLGTILIEADVISPKVLEKEIRRHIVEVIHDLLKWEKGSFHFELGAPSEDDVVLESGLNTEYLLLEATRIRDEDRHNRFLEEKPFDLLTTASTSLKPGRQIQPAASELKRDGEKAQSRGIKDMKPDPIPMSGRRDAQLLTLMVEELSRHTTGSEITLLILRFANEIMNRAVIFLAQDQEILGFGQSGVVLPGGGNSNERIRNIRIPLTEESIFRSVMGKKLSYKGKLTEDRWNRVLVEQLGRGWPAEVYVAPLMYKDLVIAMLYGDNLPALDAISETEGLEAFIKVAGFSFGRALFEGGLQRPE
jgi:hypothetical protein